MQNRCREIELQGTKQAQARPMLLVGMFSVHRSEVKFILEPQNSLPMLPWPATELENESHPSEPSKPQKEPFT